MVRYLRCSILKKLFSLLIDIMGNWLRWTYQSVNFLNFIVLWKLKFISLLLEKKLQCHRNFSHPNIIRPGWQRWRILKFWKGEKEMMMIASKVIIFLTDLALEGWNHCIGEVSLFYASLSNKAVMCDFEVLLQFQLKVITTHQY